MFEFFFGVGGWGNNFRMRGSLLAVARFVWLLRSFFNELQICLKVMVFFTCSQFYIFLIQCRRIQEQTGVGREPQQTNDLSQRLYRHLVVGFRSLFFYKVLRFFYFSRLSKILWFFQVSVFQLSNYFSSQSCRRHRFRKRRRRRNRRRRRRRRRRRQFCFSSSLSVSFRFEHLLILLVVASQVFKNGFRSNQSDKKLR